ncbi:hypothetical protein [Pseudoxanthomonas sp. CF125]|uniref:hypothetical protein n=1 Tax=Pseudoxanthomonas sp. CF125 TaxID=1855303 RepID=UPI00087F4D64|nr:hypothetical protein [Pseudoxanthomonas sp. CF125]SDR10706.1 hypothetical protein SAMN05216569_3126 [Pseudoxanthomonas sp. CF125]
MSVTKLLVVLGGLLIVSSAVKAATDDLPPFVPFDDDAPIRKLIIEKSSLKDPFSVQFRNLSLRTIHLKGPPEEVSLIYCGELNAKNSVGAYVGWSRFYATSLGKSVYISEKSKDFYFDLYCGDAPNLNEKQ